MKISTKAKLATLTVIATIGFIALMIWRANSEVEDAQRQRRHTTAITRALSDLRLVTFEYILHRQERARLQEKNVASRLGGLLSDNPFDGPEQARLLDDLRRRHMATHRLFGELQPASTDEPADAVGNKVAMRRFEDQLSSRLLIYQQESVSDAARLAESATERINAAQRRVVIVIVAGLAVIAAIIGTAAWLLRRDILVPIGRLEQATREVAAGNWDYQLDIVSGDEIGQMASNFSSMTGTLRDSFARIERSNQELAALNTEIEAFSYSVSHDLRSPLRSMDGFALALLEDHADKLDEDGRDALQRIRAASQRMGRLIDELLGLSRVTRAELSIRPVNLSEIAREIAASLDRQQPERAMRWEIDEGMTVQADQALMWIAMQNLLENAWKFTGKSQQPVIHVGVEEQEGRRICFVADNGVGFDMAYAGRLFGAFQRLHHESEFSGTGIGLAIVQRIFLRHGAKIWVHAQPDRGATFFFNLMEQGNERDKQDHLAG
ncbi:ATP-binding protein [Paucibacter sp. O1-1]|nr:ATP-binding protein [Paucibacter sp. O1-1]MDA3831269.1 ATP-binding protein [Paucibacter sp. O1-1]